ncbi:protein-L-isoaspartate O-methyltransferase [Murinocardiopsis flavida]|uniref:Protein-L-isoaspartate O-methyltransferase n=1 Tax=Murinocardiopsis flavida TaxID=645275 RepID=A0A2P8DDZ0_9ACTN|nr:methyltransferase domain-containing protein [Murinocardiopsis flavida]PSK95444.1 protein-L-isoaspartate O-methyltransferase [Murinocardiopsis flavida]
MTDHGSQAFAQSAAQRHAALADALVRSGELADDRLAAAFRVTPRHLFIPATGAHSLDGAALDAGADAEGWLSAVYSDEVVITRLGAGGTPAHPGLAATSSSSAPTIVARMLSTADLREGHRVLEIGAGTGWNAALLAVLLGDDAVTSVDIDPDAVAAARAALARLGRSPTVLHRDGEAGYPPNAPYDRVIATCNAARVPLPWIEQTATGGLVVTPWSTVDGFGGALARLTKAADGSAAGPLLGRLGFIWLRGQRPPPVDPGGLMGPPEHRSRTTVDPIPWLSDWDATFPLSFMVRSWRGGLRRTEHGPAAWLTATGGDGSWARIIPEETGWTIEQAGPRRLWDELRAALEQWRDQGRPGADRYGLTVAPDGVHRAWLDSPDGPGWTLPAWSGAKG